jgi:hypothetical protein
MRLLIETGNESHTTSWQKCQAKYSGGPNDGKFLYQVKSTIVSQEWVKQDKHQTVVRTVYELPEGTDVLIDYNGHEGPEKFIVRLDGAEEVKEQEVGTSRLRTYLLKGRYHLVRDLIKQVKNNLKASQEEGF